MALDVKPGDEVLCPAFTFFATGGSVARLGAVPVMVDVCPICFNLDVNDARRKITAKTKAKPDTEAEATAKTKTKVKRG